MFNTLEGDRKEQVFKMLIAYAGKTLNKTDEELASVFMEEDEFNENALNVLLTSHSEHVQSLQGNTTELFDNAYSKGKKESLTAAEKKLKAKYSITNDGNFEELVTVIIEGKENEFKETYEAKSITDLDVQNHPLYKALEGNLETSNSAWQEKFEQRDQEVLKQQVSLEVSKYASGIIAELKPVFDTDPKRAKNQESFLLSQICELNWKIDNGVPILVDADGIYLKNQQGHKIDPKKRIEEIVTNYHSLEVNSAHNSFSGNGTPPKPGAQQFQEMPTDSKEYIQRLGMLNKTDNADEMAKLKDWAKVQPWY